MLASNFKEGDKVLVLAHPSEAYLKKIVTLDHISEGQSNILKSVCWTIKEDATWVFREENLLKLADPELSERINYWQTILK